MPDQLATTDKKDVRSVIQGMSGQFALALPKLLTTERFIRIALTTINKTPKLLQCTRESLLACLMDCAMLGIEPDGRRAHLIPYGDKCTLIVDYKGIAELVRRSGEISSLHAGIVYEGDDFDYMFGTGAFLKHKPAMDRPEEAKRICVYSHVKLKTGDEDFDVMPIAEVDKIRKRSRAANNGPWVTDFDEMAKKTAFRRHSKWLPLSPELRDKIEKDDEALTEAERFHAAKPVPSDDIQFGDALPVEAEPPKKKKKEDAPPRATPVEALRNLMATSKIEEPALLTYLFGQGLVEQGDKIDTLSEDKLKLIIDKWLEIAPEIEKEK